MDLSKVLAEMRAAGVTRGKYTEEADGRASLDVEFGKAPRAAALAPVGFVGRDGEPLDLDEGMGPLERDPLGGEDDEGAPAPDPMLTRNFAPKVPDAAS